MEVNLKNCLSNSNGKLSSLLENRQQLPEPFKNLLVFQNLIPNDKVVGQLRDDINSSVRLKKKDNDLYKFRQSKDLLTETQAKKLTPLIHKFADAMQDEVRRELEKLTNKQLSVKYFDITVSRYDKGNYLLCHNDDIKDLTRQHRRTLAFVYYLNTRPWSRQQDGGKLQLFECDATGEPVRLCNTISPQPNSLVVFETSETSWHAVEEVTREDDFRLSINGWFHTEVANQTSSKLVEDSFEVDQRLIEPCPFHFVRPIPLDDRLEQFFRDYFNPEYLMEKTCLLVRRRFKRESEINLTNFLNKEKFNEISEALRQATDQAAADVNLEQVGPYNKRNYRRLRLDKLPQVCRDLHEAFRSELFFMFLARITGLDLQPPSIKLDRCDDANNSHQAANSSSQGSNSDSNEDEDSDDDEDDSDENDDDEDEDLGLEDESSESDCEDGDDIVEKEEAKLSRELLQQPSQSIVDQYKDEKSTTQTTSVQNNHDDDKGKPTTSKQQRSQEGGKSDGIQRAKKRRRTADPLVRHEFRHLDAGSYTLIHDHGFEMGERSALDVILHFNHDFEVNFEHGGYISYMDGAPEEDLHSAECELLTVEPKSNCLSLAYRCDEGTCRFLKYITKSHKSAYQDLYCVYYERPDDLPPNSAAHISSSSSSGIATSQTNVSGDASG